MSDNRYRFQLGDFECIAIQDSDRTMGADILFSNVPADVLEPILKANKINPKAVERSYTCLAVHMGDEWVLIDTGHGDAYDNVKANLLDVLEDEEIDPRHIIITHAHGDHFSGLIGKNGKPNFPKAMVYMCRDEWAVFTSEDFLEANPRRADSIRKHLMPARGQIERVECHGEVLPGFTLIPLPGHSPHHVGVLIESAGEKLIFAGDAVHHPLHLQHLDWQLGFDADHEQARESRIELAEMAIDLDALVLPFHFEFPGLGKIVAKGDAFDWIPLAAN